MTTSTIRRAVLGAALAASLACASDGAGPGGPGAGGGPEVPDPAAALGRLVDALDAGRWKDAHSLLSARWRTAYTPSRLAADYRGAGPLAREAAAHVRTALRARTPVDVAGGRASMPVAGGRAVVVAEGAGWRVDALE